MSDLCELPTGRACFNYFPDIQTKSLPLAHLKFYEKRTIKAIVEQIVANVFHVSVRQLHSKSRNRAHVAFARQTAMYLSHVVCGLNFSEVGELFHRDRTTVAHACKCVEDQRDNLAFDRGMDFLETATTLLLSRVKSFNGEVI
ncbi:MAG: helix-turn-helix domain-containing protein [Pseudomonadota bacterium]